MFIRVLSTRRSYCCVLKLTERRSRLELRFNWSTTAPMGKLSLTFVAVGVAACGNSNNNNSVDAHVVVPDTKPIDAPKVFLDAPPSTYNFACAGMTAPA